MADNAAWDGTITRLRFDPFDAAGFMDIDYIRLVQKDGYVWIDPDKRPFTIVNGDAEDVFNPGFVGYVKESGITSDPDAPSNNCYYVMGEADKNAYMYLYQPVRYKPGATYKVECDVRLMSYGTSLEIPADMVTTICANARYVQEDGTYDHVIDKKVEKLGLADGWVHWSFEFTVAENRVESARDQLAFYSNPKNNNGFGFYLDNVVVTEELPKEDETSDS